MAPTTYDRLDRLAGDAMGSWGGGLPLPQLFQAVAAEMLDHGPRTVADLVRPVERAVPKPERIRAIYGALDPYEQLITDVLGQLASRRLAAHGDDGWALTDEFRTGEPVVVIPARAGSRGRRARIEIVVYPRDERERLSAKAIEDRELLSMYSDMHNDRSFEVKVGVKVQQLRLHPLARSIPQISQKEFEELAADIKAHGVKVPVVVYDGQVLDGRHRVAVAAALRVPVRVEKFTGDETAARDHVISLNVKRRHLTIAQRALIVQELFLPEAEAKARERQLAGTANRTNTIAPDGAKVETDTNRTNHTKALEDAAKQSGGLATVRTLQRMAPVRDAPKTQEKIRSGEIKTSTAARREAIKETGRDEPEQAPAAQLRTAYSQIGRARTALRDARASIERGEVSGTPVLTVEWNERLDEIIGIARSLKR